MSAAIHRPAPPNTATRAWFTAANAMPATTEMPAKAHHCPHSYDAAICTTPATRTPCSAPSAAAGTNERSARAADDSRADRACRGTAWRAMKVAEPAEPQREHREQRGSPRRRTARCRFPRLRQASRRHRRGWMPRHRCTTEPHRPRSRAPTPARPCRRRAGARRRRATGPRIRPDRCRLRAARLLTQAARRRPRTGRCRPRPASCRPRVPRHSCAIVRRSPAILVGACVASWLSPSDVPPAACAAPSAASAS